ncbi:hypothetical protein BRARA_G02408 [Brassica rapa]|uniref:THH1/TOM1/TOM3 domain-containing protein n=1 Tax=Brassica campestris TaxID=3711 RepID=A0A397YP01_BRACM|nr:hypothetical protein BRARA_G02408 [Brassica rapa]
MDLSSRLSTILVIFLTITSTFAEIRKSEIRSDDRPIIPLDEHYYIVVICYIYFTRVVVYALETITSYKYMWTSVVASELATLAFYLFTGYKFRPEVHNPYFVVDDDEEEAAAEALKLEDEFEL